MRHVINYFTRAFSAHEIVNYIFPLLTRVTDSNISLGPYVWRERHYKDVIQWNENDTITFQQRKQWEFVPEVC